MRTFFCLSAGLAVCALGSLAVADEKPALQQVERGIKVTPERIAGIDRNFHRTTPWMEYDGGTSWPGDCGQDLAFDCFEPDENGDPIDENPGCDMGSSRLYFGSTYCNMFIANDMETENLITGDSLTMGYAWYWYVEGKGTTEHCYVAVFTAEEFDDTCVGPATSNGYDGVIVDYGVLDSCTDVSGYYYYTAPVDLCEYGLALTLPQDGRGAYESILANDYDDTYIYQATCAQFMLWGTDPERAGYQGGYQWDDDNPIDGQHDPRECYWYWWGHCPEIYGAMFYCTGNLDPGPCLELTIDGEQAGGSSMFILSDLTPRATGAVLYSFQQGSFVFEGFGWNVDFGLQFNGPRDALDHIVFQDVDSNGDGIITDSIYIPCAAGHLTIYFQGSEKGTEEPCMSNIVEVYFQPC